MLKNQTSHEAATAHIAMTRVLLSHAARYPRMQALDAVKLCYQAAFGGGHLIHDPDAARAWIHRERTQAETDQNIPLFEELGCGMVRLNFAAPECANLSDDLIFSMFDTSAKAVFANKDNQNRFSCALDTLHLCTENAWMPFSLEALETALSALHDTGFQAVHHSEAYREAYHPSYRVMEAHWIHLLPLIQKIDALLSAHHNDTPILIAIDGRAASGKTTYANRLAGIYDCNVFHMDDYFLPPKLRTDDRLSTPGGNVHYERFKEEILFGIQSKKPFSYRPFDCQTGCLQSPVTAAPKRLNIIEGAYALHPYFGDCYSIRTAVTCSPLQQAERIRTRNGEQMLGMFTGKWIPLEEQYLQAFQIFMHADITILND